MSKARTILDVGSTIIVSAAALTLVGFQLSDRFTDRRRAPAKVIATWQADNAQGIRIGSSAAPIVITEFMDFQCPFCKRLVPKVDTLLTEFPGAVAVVFQHYPLKSHPSAVPAAISAECAHRQGRFLEMYRVLFEHQAVLGKKPWRDLAAAAKVPDLQHFERCTGLPVDSFPRIKAGLTIGSRTGVRGTPTVWVNGRVQALDADSIRARVKRLGKRAKV
jgi:protein-disulfide isomerase